MSEAQKCAGQVEKLENSVNQLDALIKTNEKIRSLQKEFDDKFNSVNRIYFYNHLIYYVGWCVGVIVVFVAFTVPVYGILFSKFFTLTDSAKADYSFTTAAYLVTVFVIADLLLVLVPFWCIYHKEDD